MANKQNRITVSITDKAMENYLFEFGLNDFFEDQHYQELFHNTYVSLKAAFDRECPQVLKPTGKAQKDFFFKDEEDFNKRATNYFKRVVVHTLLMEHIRHPRRDMDSIWVSFQSKIESIIDNSMAMAINDILAGINEYKISLGQFPFGADTLL